MSEIYYSDEQLCEFLNISYSTLYNHLKNGPPQIRHQNAPDIRKIKYVVKNGRRWWLKTSANEFKRGEKC